MSRRYWILIALLLLASSALAEGRRALPVSLKSSFSLSHGNLLLDNENYSDFFGDNQLPVWSLRYDHLLYGPLSFGLGVTASGKSHLRESISIGSEAYPVIYNYSAFQYQWELGLRLRLPRIAQFRSYASWSLLTSRVHTLSEGYASGYDANWEEHSPTPDSWLGSTGSRASLGFSHPFWANMSLFAEASRIRMDDYGELTESTPPSGLWNHSGWRLDFGILQQF
ncbi:MAG: hypothetical protein QF492_08025 [Candidatus Krumholzibacteria bacterium]|jgi:hypothetical protein|nr:hypothetical protein [Candidatus Krumholzibacteria bacterium]MDP6669834.1 hypothetical protein [Candidatus Krumholzibacteria bacterium]MDP7022233.1 hypothetical protein [Candidatus Krumholzibacteria bacterium]